MRPDDRRRNNGRAPKWDADEGKRMYDAGVRICDIARTLGASTTAVSSYAYRNWTPAAAKGLTGRAQPGEEK